jgi:hypothetical protein
MIRNRVETGRKRVGAGQKKTAGVASGFLNSGRLFQVRSELSSAGGA